MDGDGRRQRGGTTGESSPLTPVEDSRSLPAMADYVSGQQDIPFDYSGALYAARSLHGLAASTRDVATDRRTIADTALADWEGALRTEFIGRADAEIAALESAATELESGAVSWATAWRDIMFENNKRRRARAVQQISDDRDGLSKAWDAGPGSDDSNDKVVDARQPALPTAPGFYSTDDPQAFSA